MDAKISYQYREHIGFSGYEGNTLAGDLHAHKGEVQRGTVVLLHGGGQTRHSWRATATELASRGWTAISLDQRGHGDSAWVESKNYHFEDFAKDCTSVAGQIEQQFGTRPVVIGASLGGIAAMLAEGETAAQVLEAVILVDVTPRMRHDGVEKIIGFMSERAGHGFATLEEAADAIADYLPHRPRPKDLSGLAKNLRLGSDNRYHWHWDPEFLSERNRKAERADRETFYIRLEHAVRAISIPLMLVRGRLSELVDEAMVAEFVKLAPHAECADVSEAGHMVAGDKNDIFTNAVLGFLDKRR
jgi:pimeloyl-ACP methyl ester carboxylesterase